MCLSSALGTLVDFEVKQFYGNGTTLAELPLEVSLQPTVLHPTLDLMCISIY